MGTRSRRDRSNNWLQATAKPPEQNVLCIIGIGIGIGIEGQKNATRKALLDRIVAMLTKLEQRGYTVREDKPQYTIGIDTDPDSDPDTDGNQEQTGSPTTGCRRRPSRLSQT
jgi:hypothetical protein